MVRRSTSPMTLNAKPDRPERGRAGSECRELDRWRHAAAALGAESVDAMVAGHPAVVRGAAWPRRAATPEATHLVGAAASGGTDGGAAATTEHRARLAANGNEPAERVARVFAQLAGRALRGGEAGSPVRASRGERRRLRAHGTLRRGRRTRRVRPVARRREAAFGGKRSKQQDQRQLRGDPCSSPRPCRERVAVRDASPTLYAQASFRWRCQ
jgi:hypothetical protein